ncbi:DUF2752 domain-containing protein [Aquihabitans sp. G128]|uniref:DUF2752 domain-containing protein n=1 Tax=Aquihabitans sp. G128 TaxID=2849779 RepID=UPI001C2125F7|nr:DUF2752 domain-containing protein [Aquihabitans sp. G128]QXC62120.1 DUF2752 domain-containing protein [Aquihabitans sp. G128]
MAVALPPSRLELRGAEVERVPPVAARGSVPGWVAVGVAGAGTVLLAGRALGLHPGPCLLRAHAGLACPACGLTRLSLALGRGDLVGAVGRDLPGVTLLALLAVAAGAQLAATSGRPPVRWLASPWLAPALVALLLAHWAVTVAFGGFAP